VTTHIINKKKKKINFGLLRFFFVLKCLYLRVIVDSRPHAILKGIIIKMESVGSKIYSNHNSFCLYLQRIQFFKIIIRSAQL
jgi:hypothetical protein